MQFKFGLISLALILAQTASAQTGPVRMVVGFPPGGSADTTARLLADKMKDTLGVSVVVENKPGASGNIGNAYVARAKPDGYTLLVSYSGYHVGNPHLFKQSGWDPVKDFAPVAMMTRAPQVIAVNPKLPVNNLKELIAFAKANPGKLGSASYSPGTRSQYAGILFNAKAGLDLLQVPYKGSPPVITDLIAGHMALAFDVVPNMLPYIRAGKMKAFALAAGSRSPLLPEVPTFAERGFPDLQFSGWMSLWVTGRTSEVLAGQIHEAVWRAWNTPAVRERLLAAGFDPVADKTLAQQRDELKAQSSFNQGIVQRVGIKLE